MNNKLVAYPFESYPYKGFMLDKLMYLPSVLELFLSNDNEGGIKISFNGFYSFRVIDESDVIKMQDEFDGEMILGIYNLVDSEYLEWFHEQSVGIHLDGNITHYMVVTVNDVIEIISCEKPVISMI
ncbi:hypothetical protein [Rosenbergiella nectarea]|uniref:hypothetical protein n=1 Tax=Rosenbergiella nectarea TaxID=988801 RepID=UPI001F4EB8B4|nr:hypothetical protein [Rosenbergiella nectarea]